MESNIVMSKGKYTIEHTLNDDQCFYCNMNLTTENTVVFDLCSNDYEDTKLFCKPCTTILLKQMNITICDGNGIKVCHNCGLPLGDKKTKKRECICKFDTKKKQKWK